MPSAQSFERTGDYAAAFESRAEIGPADSADGGGGVEIGETLSAARLLGIQGRQGLDQAAMIGVGAQRVGAMTLADVARSGTPAIAAWAAAGESGVEAWRELMAALQVGMQATGSADLAGRVRGGLHGRAPRPAAGSGVPGNRCGAVPAGDC